MKFTKNNLSSTQIELAVELNQADLAPAEKQALTELAKTVTAKGFRKGKVPPAVAKKQLDPNQLAEATLDLAINHHLIKILEQEQIQVLDRPKVDLVKYVPEQTAEFKATFTVVPEVKLPNYKKLGVKPQIAKFDETEVDDTLERIRKSFAITKPADRAAKNGDKVVIDFKGYVDDKPFEGGSAENYSLELGSNSFIPGFEEAIVGHKAEEKFDIKVKFPKDYHAKDLKGKPATFTVTLKQVEEVSLPKLDDKLAKQVGGFKDLEALKVDIRKNIIVQKEERLEQDFRDELVKALAEGAKADIPESLKQEQINSIRQDLMQNLAYRGQKLEDYLQQIDKTEEDWVKSELEPAAESRVKAGLALSELSKILKVEVSDEEVEARHNLLLTQYAKNPEAAAQLNQPEVRRDLRNNLLTQKTIDQLAELNR